MNLHRTSTSWGSALRRAPLLALLAAGASFGQYKVVGPDGKVTYTDRAPTSNEGKATALSSRGGSATAVPDGNLPAELRQVAARYPVTLYTVASACELCSAARQLLRQRGIPYAEKSIATREDGEALQSITGARDLPALTVGSQVLRGFQRDDWNSYLDAAAYPKESKLPANFPQGSATPLTEPKQAVKANTPQNGNAPAAQPQQSSSGDSGSSGSNPAGIKF